MARTRIPEPKGPDWPPEKTIRELKNRLRELQSFKEKRWRDVENAEREWRQLTESIIRHGFGEDSDKTRQFAIASNAGSHRFGGVSEGQLQRNFILRTDRFTAVLNSAIRELELELPEPEIRGTYEPGNEYGFYKDLKGIVATAQREVFIADNYLNTEVFDLYVDPISSGVSVRIITDEIRGNLDIVTKKYATRGNFELRSSKDVHDRVIFVDGRCWLVGQSIKDAARKKPTYMVEFQDAGRIQDIYEDIWNRASTVVKS